MLPSRKAPEGSPNESSMSVVRLPTCEYCLDRAEYYGDTTRGRKGNMCVRHFRQYGCGVGRGKGWHLVVMPESDRKA